MDVNKIVEYSYPFISSYNKQELISLISNTCNVITKVHNIELTDHDIGEVMLSLLNYDDGEKRGTFTTEYISIDMQNLKLYIETIYKLRNKLYIENEHIHPVTLNNYRNLTIVLTKPEVFLVCTRLVQHSSHEESRTRIIRYVNEHKSSFINYSTFNHDNVLRDIKSEILETMISFGMLSYTTRNKMSKVTYDMKRDKYINFMSRKPHKPKILPVNQLSIFSIGSQLSFYHKFINNRVLFITGSTGIGKTANIPKLANHALLVCDFNPYAKVIVTQPRISSIKSSSYNMKENMGLDETTIQQSYKGCTDKIPNYNKISFIRFVTDGKYFIQFIEDDTKYSIGNNDDNSEHDVIMIDEIHEHNANQDLLLALCKKRMYNNPKLHLILLSATMNDDYYMYLKYFEDFKSIHVGQRHNVAKFNKPTPYKINDIIYNYVFSYDDVLNKVKTIAMENNKTILLFTSTKKLVENYVKDLNKYSDGTLIALPFYSKLPNDYSDVITKGLRWITVHPNDGFDVNKIINTLNMDASKKIYNSYIIVATTIAESSITIDGVTDVVDTGIQTTVSYNVELNQFDTDNKDPISNQSYMQRRGRTGRTNDGNAYFLGDINITKNKKTNYNTDLDNIESYIYHLRKVYTDTELKSNKPFIRELKGIETYIRRLDNYDQDILRLKFKLSAMDIAGIEGNEYSLLVAKYLNNTAVNFMIGIINKQPHVKKHKYPIVEDKRNLLDIYKIYKKLLMGINIPGYYKSIKSIDFDLFDVEKLSVKNFINSYNTNFLNCIPYSEYKDILRIFIIGGYHNIYKRHSDDIYINVSDGMHLNMPYKSNSQYVLVTGNVNDNENNILITDIPSPFNSCS